MVLRKQAAKALESGSCTAGATPGEQALLKVFPECSRHGACAHAHTHTLIKCITRHVLGVNCAEALTGRCRHGPQVTGSLGVLVAGWEAAQNAVNIM